MNLFLKAAGSKYNKVAVLSEEKIPGLFPVRKNFTVIEIKKK